MKNTREYRAPSSDVREAIERTVRQWRELMSRVSSFEVAEEATMELGRKVTDAVRGLEAFHRKKAANVRIAEIRKKKQREHVAALARQRTIEEDAEAAAVAEVVVGLQAGEDSIQQANRSAIAQALGETDETDEINKVAETAETAETGETKRNPQ